MKLFEYFTFWILLLQAMYYNGYLKNYQFSILILLFTISFGSFFLIYIYPKYFIFDLGFYKLVFKGNMAKLYDMAIHHIPLLIFVLQYDYNIKNDNSILAFTLIALYLILYDPVKIYNLN